MGESAMNVEPGGSQGRWSSRVARIRARRLVGGILLCIVSVAVAGLTVLLSGPHPSGAGIVGFGLFVLVLLAPALTVGGCCAAAGVRTVRRRRAESALQPANPPLEQIAASLRRLLWKHDTVVRTGDPALSVWQLRALEVAI